MTGSEIIFQTKYDANEEPNLLSVVTKQEMLR